MCAKLKNMFCSRCKRGEAIYQALWAENGDFDEVLVSPTMVNDHMPDNVLESLEKVIYANTLST